MQRASSVCLKDVRRPRRNGCRRTSKLGVRRLPRLHPWCNPEEEDSQRDDGEEQPQQPSTQKPHSTAGENQLLTIDERVLTAPTLLQDNRKWVTNTQGECRDEYAEDRGTGVRRGATIEAKSGCFGHNNLYIVARR